MNDLISRLSEIRSNYNCFDENEEPYYRALSEVIQLASAQPTIFGYDLKQPKSNERTAESAQNVPNDELISKKSAIEVIGAVFPVDPMKSEYAQGIACGAALAKTYVEQLPSAQPTLYGYDIKHLMLIAEVLRKENLPPERVSDALTDIEHIINIVRDEFEETLRESMNQFKI